MYRNIPAIRAKFRRLFKSVGAYKDGRELRVHFPIPPSGSHHADNFYDLLPGLQDSVIYEAFGRELREWIFRTGFLSSVSAFKTLVIAGTDPVLLKVQFYVAERLFFKEKEIRVVTLWKNGQGDFIMPNLGENFALLLIHGIYTSGATLNSALCACAMVPLLGVGILIDRSSAGAKLKEPFDKIPVFSVVRDHLVVHPKEECFHCRGGWGALPLADPTFISG